MRLVPSIMVLSKHMPPLFAISYIGHFLKAFLIEARPQNFLLTFYLCVFWASNAIFDLNNLPFSIKVPKCF